MNNPSSLGPYRIIRNLFWLKPTAFCCSVWMSFPLRRRSWRAISANYSSASFRNLSFRRCHHTSPPATQTFGINEVNVWAECELCFCLFLPLTPVSLQIKTPLQSLKWYLSDTVKNLRFVFLPNTFGVPVCQHWRENNEEFKQWMWRTEGDGSISCLRRNFLCFKKPLMQPMTHFRGSWFLWVFAVCCVHARAFLRRFQSCKKEVIISSSQSFRQNEDTIIHYLNK